MLLIGTKWIIPDCGGLYQYQKPDKLHPVHQHHLPKQPLLCRHGLQPWDIKRIKRAGQMNDENKYTDEVVIDNMRKLLGS